MNKLDASVTRSRLKTGLVGCVCVCVCVLVCLCLRVHAYDLMCHEALNFS